jgi:hypothetical protein
VFSPGPMLVFAGRYMAGKSALNGPVVILDFGNLVGPPVELASFVANGDPGNDMPTCKGFD